MQRYTIVHSLCHIQWGGLERRVFNEARWMAARGHRMCIVAPEGSPVCCRAREEGWLVEALKFSRVSLISDIFRFRRILQTLRPDILNTHGNIDTKAGLCAAMGLHIPCIILSRHITAPVPNSFYNRMLYRNLCDTILTTSESAREQIVRSLSISSEKIFSVPSGIIPPENLISQHSAHLEMTRLLQRPQRTQFIGFVGRVTREKGVDYIVEAFAGIQNRFPNLELVLAGHCDYPEELTADIRARSLADRVHLIGYQEDIWKLYRAFACMLLASVENEGVPQSLIESMYARCPVVGTCVGGIPEILKNGELGWLVRPRDAADIAAALTDIIEHPELTRMKVEKACAHVKNHHTIDQMGSRLLYIYQGCQADQRRH
ncbi:MAG: glycosyltransferase family 4 protein [Desulfobulbus sp.]|nr:glycosyltransferase family 4 protein [Desulfobulbus sp.]